MRLAEIAIALGARLENGSPDLEITGVSGIREAGPGQLTFVANPKYAGEARTTKASAVIVVDEFPSIPPALLRSKNPYLAFARAIELFCQPPRYEPGVHPTAVLHPSARVGEGAHIGPYVVVDQDVEIGNNAVLLAHVVIYRALISATTFLPMHTRWCGKAAGSAIACCCRMAWLLEPMASASPRTTQATGTKFCSLNQ